MASHVVLDKEWDEAMKQMLAIWQEETVLMKPETEEQKKAKEKEKKKKKGKKNNNEPPPTPPILLWSVLYVRYLQVYTRLEDCYDQMVHPQKRRDAKKALEACIGRILEVKSFIVLLNEGGQYPDFSQILLEKKLGYDVLDVMPSRFLSDDNRGLLEIREKFLIAALEAAGLMHAKPKELPPTGLTEEEAVIIIQAEERGRQARQKINEILKIRAMQEVDLARQKAGIDGHSRESAGFIIQRLIRGFLARAQTRHDELDELTLIGMNNFRAPDPNDPRMKVEEIKERRKQKQLKNESELQGATPGALSKIKQLEGQEMCEIVQEKINHYLNETRDPESGQYMGLPKKKEGGSALIVDPLPPVERPEQKDAKKGEAKKGTGKTKGGQVPPPKFPEPEPDAPPRCPDFFRRFVKDSHDLFKKHWFDKDDYTNYEQKFLPDRLKSSLRPIVFEEMRLMTDDNTRVLLVNLKKKMRAEKKARIKVLMKQAKKEGKEKEFKARLKAEKTQEKKERAAAKKAMKEKKKDEPDYPPPPKKPKRKKDSTMNKTLEAIFGDLLNNEIIQLCPKRSFSEYVGSDNYSAVPPLPGWAARADPSMAQVKRAVIEYCVFPLASEMINKNGPQVHSVLLYGGEGVGKTLLVHAACRAAGATFFNLSPRTTDGKYKGAKKLSQMLQMTFKLAKIMAPSIIYVDEIEKIFINDKKKIRSWGLKDKPNKIKKGLIKEMKAIWRGDRVMLIGCTNRPTDCGGKKGPNKLTNTFLKFFDKRIYCPYPDYSSRVMVWRELLERHGAILKYGFDLSLLATFSEDFSISSIEQVIRWACSEKRLRSINRVPLIAEEIVAHCYKIKPWDIETHTRVRDFGKPPPPEDPQEKGKKGGKKPPPKK